MLILPTLHSLTWQVRSGSAPSMLARVTSNSCKQPGTSWPPATVRLIYMEACKLCLECSAGSLLHFASYVLRRVGTPTHNLMMSWGSQTPVHKKRINR